jgi:hypothetical protein
MLHFKILVLISHPYASGLEYAAITIYDPNTKLFFQITVSFEGERRRELRVFQSFPSGNAVHIF